MTIGYESYETIVAQRHGRVLRLVLNRPEVLNAVDGRMHEELARVFRDVARDREARVVVLTGAGRAFSAGGDASWFESLKGSGEELSRVLEDGFEIIDALLSVPQPVIAMVNGHAVGLGCTLALHCDIIYAADTARFADPHVRMGIVAGDGGAVIWPLLVGPARAKEFLLTGRPVSAPDAERMGLINRCLPAAELEGAVMALAEELARGPRLAVAYTKRAVNLTVRRAVNEVLTASLGLEMLTFQTADHREAVRAFREKREPRFGDA